MVKERRRSRQSDLTSELLDARIDGDALSDEEIIAFLFLMVVAGNETTTKLLGNAWYWAWRNPETQRRVLHEPDLVVPWVEETLRYDGSSQMVLRTTRTPIRAHGIEIPADERVLLLIGSANRDERVFLSPEVFDLDRDTSKMVSFGNGRHFCMGAPLARLEARVALEELLRRVRDYEIDPVRTEWVHSVNVRGFATMKTTVEVR